MAIVKELFEAYKASELPQSGGYIVSAFFDATTNYTKYEVISFSNVKEIHPADEGIVFQADGNKIFVLVEPANYSNKHVEPAYRTGMYKIPYRQKEVNVFTTSRQDKIMIGKEPVITYTSFTILKSEGNNFSYVFHTTEDIVQAIESFFKESLWKQARVPRTDAQKVAVMITEIFKKIIVKQA
jgi:hypothetical protein